MHPTPTTRRWRALAALLGALLLLGGLAACSDDDSGDDAEPSDDSTPEAAALPEADEGAFPVTIEHKFGETEITEQPERVVVAGLVEQDAVLALGTVPVATTEWFGEQPGAIFPWAQDELEALGGETPEVIPVEVEAATAEEIVALEPDVIIALYSGVTQDTYDVLSQIAPTIAQPADEEVDYGVSWQDVTLTVGQALGQSELAEELVADVEGQIAAAAAEHPEFDGASGVMATPYDGIFVYGVTDPRGRFLTELGFELPEGLEEATGDSFGGNLSGEQATLLDVDAIVWLDPADAEGELGGPLYQSLAVVDEGREVFLDSYSDDALGAATSVVSVLSLPYLLDGLVPMLAAAVDGDPATEVPSQEEVTAG
jgi:iron complex transport system substrate-binding protein